MNKQSKLAYFYASFLFFLSTNLYFSNIIVQKLAHRWTFSNPLLHLHFAKNTGAAFSIMQNSKGFLIFLSTAAVFLIFFYVIRNITKTTPKEVFFLSLLLSGIVGNLYERIYFGYVRDFFDLTFINFPIFNISDIFINVGVLGIIILLLFDRKNN